MWRMAGYIAKITPRGAKAQYLNARPRKMKSWAGGVGQMILCYSQEIAMPTDQENAIAEFLKRLEAFTNRTTEDCPYCGQHVSALTKTSRCVYASPCRCRLWQGSIPEAWQSKESAK